MFFPPNRCNLSKFAKARAPAAGARVEPEQYLASAAVVDIFGGYWLVKHIINKCLQSHGLDCGDKNTIRLRSAGAEKHCL